MKALRMLSIAALVIALGVACTKAFTRGKAEHLIEAHEEFASTDYLPVTDDAFQRARADNLWYRKGFRWEPTGEGRKYFSSAGMIGVQLVAPVSREVVEITGVKNGPDETWKEVQFQWRYRDVSSEVLKYTGVSDQPMPGHAWFRLYDDGWRLEEWRR